MIHLCNYDNCLSMGTRLMWDADFSLPFVHCNCNRLIQVTGISLNLLLLFPVLTESLTRLTDSPAAAISASYNNNGAKKCLRLIT